MVSVLKGYEPFFGQFAMVAWLTATPAVRTAVVPVDTKWGTHATVPAIVTLAPPLPLNFEMVEAIEITVAFLPLNDFAQRPAPCRVDIIDVSFEYVAGGGGVAAVAVAAAAAAPPPPAPPRLMSP